VKEENARSAPSCSWDDLTVSFVQRAFRSLRQIFIDPNVQNGFKMFQFEVDILEIPDTLRVREQKLRQNDKFQSISHLHCPLD
jgi:hypothetical protein